MSIRPLQDRLIVKRIDEEETTAGGIIIPDTAKEKPQEGKVIAVGKGKVGEDGKVQPLDEEGRQGPVLQVRRDRGQH
jgi:chaperonin GroES